MNPFIFLTIFLVCRVNITYITRDDERIDVKGKVGDNVMYLAHRYGIDIEGKAQLSEFLIYFRCFSRPRFLM